MIIKKFNNISDIIYTKLDKKDYRFIEDGDDFDAAIVRSAKLHDIELPKNLLAIARAGIGTDNIPIEKCSENGIVVFNTPGANANAVKEMVIWAILMSCRDIEGGIKWVESNDLTDLEKVKKNFIGREIAGKKLGIIGLGAIGVLVANVAISLDMEVIGYDPYLSVESALKLNRQVKIAKSKEELLKEADFVTLHLHLTEETKNTISEKEISLMKKDAVVINFARGGLVNDEAVVKAIKEGRLGHYATDFPNEIVKNQPHVTTTPHLGGSTPEAEENCAMLAAMHLDTYLRYGNIKNSVNFPNCELWFEAGYRLCIINKNITNMVGQITAVLAQKGLNIEHMLNRSKGDWAYTMIDVSTEPTKDEIDAIKNIEGVVKVRLIKG